MGYKSRPGWVIGICTKKDCLNRDKCCYKCLRFSEYKKITFDNVLEANQPDWYKKIKKVKHGKVSGLQRKTKKGSTL